MIAIAITLMIMRHQIKSVLLMNRMISDSGGKNIAVSFRQPTSAGPLPSTMWQMLMGVHRKRMRLGKVGHQR
jgi:hypothetical protein